MIRNLPPTVASTLHALPIEPRAALPRSAHAARWALLAILAGSAANVAAEEYLPPLGGTGGAQFRQPCGGDENLTGFELRAGDDIDAMRPLCVVSSGPSQISAPAFTQGSGLIAGQPPFVPDRVAPGWFGGPGGGIQRLLCPASAPIVLGMDVSAEGLNTITVNNIHLFCGQAIDEQAPEAYPSAVFDAPAGKPSSGTFGIGGTDLHVVKGSERCPEGEVAIGVHGRSGTWLDAIGLICDTPRVTHYMALGRVQSTTPGPHRTICEQAADARARNSPLAPELQAQCEASQVAAPAPPPSRFSGMTRVNSGSRDAFRAPNSAVLAPAQPAPPAAGPEVPVAGPNDLIVGRLSFEQNNRPVARVRVGVPVAIDCSYVVEANRNVFVHVHAWQGVVQIGGAAPQTLTFPGNIDSGQYSGRVMWTPAAPGEVPVGCALNPDYLEHEAFPNNNRTDQVVRVIAPQPGGH